LDINTAHAKILLPVKTPQKQPEQYKDDESVFYNKLISKFGRYGINLSKLFFERKGFPQLYFLE
jgi:hypothetical protein